MTERSCLMPKTKVSPSIKPLTSTGTLQSVVWKKVKKEKKQKNVRPAWFKDYPKETRMCLLLSLP